MGRLGIPRLQSWEEVNGRYFTVWAHGMPVAVSLSASSEAAGEYESAKQKFGLGS